MGRVQPSGGRTFSKTCLIRGKEHEGRKAILAQFETKTRIASIRADGLTDDDGVLVNARYVYDVQSVEEPGGALVTSQPGQVGERGTIVIPTPLRRRYQLGPGSPVLIEPHESGILIRPAEIVPRHLSPPRAESLDDLLAKVTPENLHGEVETGAAQGDEVW